MVPRRAPYALGDRPELGRAVLERAGERGVAVGNVQHEAHAAAAERLGAQVVLFGELAREHEHGVADAQLAVADAPVVHDDRLAEQLARRTRPGTRRWPRRHAGTRGRA